MILVSAVRAILKALFGVSLLLAVIVGILRATCISFWTVPGDDALLALSIMPTLEAGDFVMVWRVGTPGFGELVRCPDPEAPGKYVVGRILGEQGDHVIVDQSLVTLNDKLIGSIRGCHPHELSVVDPTTGEAFDLVCEIEDAGGTEHARARSARPEPRTEAFKLKVPDGQVFLVSDDRHYHDDSRDFGALPKEACNERIVFRMWSVRGWFDEARRMMFVR